MSANEKITVLNPVGFAPKVARKAFAPRLETLNGKTVYLVDCRFDDSDLFLKQMQAWFAEHMPSVRTVFKPISSVYLVDCRFDDSGLFLEQMRAWLAEHLPGVTTVLKPISSVYLVDDPKTWEEIRARGHAAILGVGH